METLWTTLPFWHYALGMYDQGRALCRVVLACMNKVLDSFVLKKCTWGNWNCFISDSPNHMDFGMATTRDSWMHKHTLWLGMCAWACLQFDCKRYIVRSKQYTEGQDCVLARACSVLPVASLLARFCQKLFFTYLVPFPQKENPKTSMRQF